MKYIALLRGINIGGHLVKMDQLRQFFTDMGLSNVRTYIQTGNVFFESSDKDREALQQKIEAHLFSQLGYAVPTFLFTVEELEEIIEKAPFKAIEITPETRHLLVFLSQPLPADVHLPLKAPLGDYEIIESSDRVAYVLLTLLNGRPTNTDIFFKKLHSIKTTARFYHTAKKILEAAKGE